MRTISALALVAWALGIPGALRAADLTFALEGASEYDSNVFRSSDDEKQDVLFRIRPYVALHEDRGQDFNFSLAYAVPAEFAVDHSEVDDVDQDVAGELSYHVNDRLEFFTSDRFRYLRNELRTNFEGTESAQDASLINEQRDRITMNYAVLGSRYQFTPRLHGTAQIDHDYFDPNRDDRQKNWQIQGNADLAYTLTPKHRIGGGVTAAHQDFDDTVDIVGSTADIYNVYGSWRYSIDEKTEFAVSAGPALIREEQDDADDSEVRRLVPFADIGPFTAPGGFVDRFGADVSGNSYANGAVLVSRLLRDCPELDGGQPVLISNQSCNFSVVLDKTPGTDDDLITEIRNATANVANVNPDGESSTNLTVFADVTLTRHWTPNLHSGLRYAREQGNASGLGGTVVGDTVTLSNTWRMTEKWEFATRGEWGLRKSVSEAGQVNTAAVAVSPPLGGLPFGPFTYDPPGPDPSEPDFLAGLAPTDGGLGGQFVERGDTTRIDTMRWGVAARTTRYFTRNTSGYLQFTYNQQTSQNDSLGNPSDFDDYLVTIGVRHQFEPIKLW